MAYKIIWTESACEDIAAIVRYIAHHNQDAAQNIGYGIYERVQMLVDFPELGSVVREVKLPDWRQIVFRSYRIVYHINHATKAVEIVRVWHGARGEIDLKT